MFDLGSKYTSEWRFNTKFIPLHVVQILSYFSAESIKLEVLFALRSHLEEHPLSTYEMSLEKNIFTS